MKTKIQERVSTAIPTFDYILADKRQLEDAVKEVIYDYFKDSPEFNKYKNASTHLKVGIYLDKTVDMFKLYVEIPGINKITNTKIENDLNRLLYNKIDKIISIFDYN